MIRALIIATLLAASTLTASAQEHTVVFYNVENLFDTLNDPAVADEEFLPLADRAWSAERYRAKLQLIANALTDIAPQPPTLIGLAEVENRAVIQDLLQTSPLENAKYAICHYDSPDERGIDVALLYQPDRFHYIGSHAITTTTASPTRDMLTVWGEMDGHPTFIVVVHWPSRIGGVRFTESERRICARQVREVVDSVMMQNPATRIIIMGDMNDNPRNKSLTEDLRATRRPTQPTELYNPFAEVRRGSSVYDGRWNKYDNIVVSINTPLLPIDGKRRAAIYRHPSLLTRRGTPRPTYDGTDHNGGASDHLPIYIVIGE